MITADQARELAGPTVQERVDAVYPMIADAASKKRRSVTLHDPFWVDGGYGGKEDWKKACAILKSNGYTVEFFYEERQFVDMYTVVKW